MEHIAYENKSRLIKNIAVDERPREKALKHGIHVLSDAELMAIIFSTGIKGKSVIDLCQEIIDAYGGLENVAKATPQELCSKHKGIGKVKAVTLLAALELGQRVESKSKDKELSVVNEAEIAYNLMRPRFLRLQHEEFWIMLIDRACHPIREVCISKGGTAATTVDIKLILKAAIDSLASRIILFHNHPSGTLRPSIEDDKLTRKIVEGARMVDVTVIDHIIVTDNGHYSYAEQGRI